MPKEVEELLNRAKNTYDRCRRYSGQHIHGVNGFAGRLLNGIFNVEAVYKDDRPEFVELRDEFVSHLNEWLIDGLKEFGEMI